MNWVCVFGLLALLPSCADLAMKEIELIDNAIVEEMIVHKEQNIN